MVAENRFSLNLDAAETMARKTNHYVTINGRKYDRELIKLAEEFTSGKRNAKISVNNAKQLLKAVKDNNRYTDIEKHTIEYIRENYTFTEKSDEWFRAEIHKWSTQMIQETKEEGAEESIVIDERDAPNDRFPSSWGEDKSDDVSETPTKDYTNYIPTPSAKPHLKKDKTVLIFLTGLFVLTGLIYFFWTLFSSEDRSEELGKTKTKIAKPALHSKTKETATKPIAEKSDVSIAEGEPKFSWLGRQNSEEFSSNPKFKEIESKAIHFEKNSIRIRKEAKPGLNRLSRWMKEDSAIRVKIFGHTSLEGTEAANQRVSLLRAETVRDYLAGNGISKDRFEIIPKGASVPIGDNSKEEGKEKNRRVELRIRN
ncbi:MULTISPECIES: OmpA family protein [Leptospira]|nr:MULTISPECIES: OmpA family protein [Leptospira]AVV51955.1 OmpA family protein [Leptospira santarosai]AVV81217.1 OmpA family protein [Leptospira santarosai]EKO76351.1 OmpA family protein [Leptospira sp. Fiocruz LV3954]EMI69982.1 OmpA family protein [Leptospira sp. Fiocruz LV4135]EMO72748.1 OmpA family protein [Leptospira santarosai str. 200403458]